MARASKSRRGRGVTFAARRGLSFPFARLPRYVAAAAGGRREMSVVRALTASIFGIALCLSTGTANAHGISYWLYGGKEVQLVGLAAYRAKRAPDVKICAIYLGTREDYKAGRKALVDLSDLLFEQYVGTVCGDQKDVSNITVFAGPLIVTVSSESTIGRGNIAAGRTWMQGLIDDEPEQETNIVPISAYNGGLSLELCQERNSGMLPLCEVRVDYVAAKRGQFERVTHKQVPVLPSPLVQNPEGTPTQIAPGVTIALEGVFELNPENERKPYAVIFYRTEVPIGDAAASDALAKTVLQALVGDKLKSGAIRGAMAVPFNEPRLGRFHIRDRRVYREFP
jgi:hypothetical protein